VALNGQSQFFNIQCQTEFTFPQKTESKIPHPG
jgi:hypothetical protein